MPVKNSTTYAVAACTEVLKLSKSLLDYAIEEAQACLKASPVIVLGSGASIPSGLPSMNALAGTLSESIPVETLADPDKSLWEQFIEALATKDLESALQETKLSERLSDHVIEQTWRLVSVADANAFEAAINDATYLPLVQLYRHLFNSTHRTLSVVTTNYDRLAEYAADLAGFCHNTGFSYGYLRQKQSSSRLSFWQGDQQARTIDIWKVHGCLDWFVDSNGHVTALTAARTIPAGRRPAIVTPGIEKYERTHREPFRSIIAGADTALDRASAYLCIGFGFNDAHIQPKLLERWQRGDAQLVILAKTLSKSAKKMLEGSQSHYLALEEAAGGTRVWSHNHPKGAQLEGIKFWRLQNFLEHTT